jgi:hypothetical protein
MRVLGYAPEIDVLGLDAAGAEVFSSMTDVPRFLGLGTVW